VKTRKQRSNPNDATMRNIKALKKRVAKLESAARVQSLINDTVKARLKNIEDYLNRRRRGGNDSIKDSIVIPRRHPI